MAGFPVRSLDEWQRILVEAGLQLAICNQQPFKKSAIPIPVVNCNPFMIDKDCKFASTTNAIRGVCRVLCVKVARVCTLIPPLCTYFN